MPSHFETWGWAVQVCFSHLNSVVVRTKQAGLRTLPELCKPRSITWNAGVKKLPVLFGKRCWDLLNSTFWTRIFLFTHLYKSLLKYYLTKHYLDVQLKRKKRIISEFVFVSPKRKNNQLGSMQSPPHPTWNSSLKHHQYLFFSGGRENNYVSSKQEVSASQRKPVLTWNSFMYCAITNSCLSLGEGSANISGRGFEIWLFFWAAVPFRWQSNPILPGNWNLWSWGPNGPITSSGHTVLGPVKVKALL